MHIIIAVNIFFQYGGGDGVDMKEFPEFNFTDQKIDPINISQWKQQNRIL